MITEDEAEGMCHKCDEWYVISKKNPLRAERHKLYGAGKALCECPKCGDEKVLNVEMTS